MHATLETFGYPQTLIKEFEHWVVVARPRQITLGSCVIICKHNAVAVGKLKPEIWAKFSTVTAELEAALKSAFAYDKINYLCLMMVDPQVHFHALPRYESPRLFNASTHVDQFWPKPCDLTQVDAAASASLSAIRQKLIDSWPA